MVRARYKSPIVTRVVKDEFSRPVSGPIVGTVLEGLYRLNRVIARGGMGTVYEATQLRLGKRVAIKVLSQSLASNPEAMARFRREAEVTSGLGHPHIVNVFDFGTSSDGSLFLAMEYLDGEDLEQRLLRVGQMSVTAALAVARQVASALAAAHRKGIVHRDLKPANIVLLKLPHEPAFVKIVDFGISKVRAAATRITLSSSLMGTPRYMSPEQAAGRVDLVDHRTDQWALACIVWEMLAGRTPFVGDDVQALLYQVAYEEPPDLRTLAPHAPASLDAVFRRALSKDKGARFADMGAFVDALVGDQPLDEADEITLRWQAPPPVRVEPRRLQTLSYAEGSSAGASRGMDVASKERAHPRFLRAAPWRWAVGAAAAMALTVAVDRLGGSRSSRSVFAPAPPSALEVEGHSIPPVVASPKTVTPGGASLRPTSASAVQTSGSTLGAAAMKRKLRNEATRPEKARWESDLIDPFTNAARMQPAARSDRKSDDPWGDDGAKIGVAKPFRAASGTINPH